VSMATRDNQEAMENFHSEKNILHQVLTICGYCKRVEKERGVKMSRCSRCRMVNYCSQEFQKKIIRFTRYFEGKFQKKKHERQLTYPFVSGGRCDGLCFAVVGYCTRSRGG
jgi:hypothetical protein